MPPTIEIDDEIYELLRRNAEPLVDTPSSVLRRLLGLDTNGDEAGAEPTASSDSPPTTKPRTTGRGEPGRRTRRRNVRSSRSRRAARGTLLPEPEYELPILRYLVSHDGRAPSREVTDAVGEELDDRLTPADRERLSSGDIRWKNRVAFVRLRLVERGDLDANAPRGTWQITDQGRERVQSAN